MNDFHARAVAADFLKTQNPTPVTTSEWTKLLNQIDEAQDIAARSKAVK